MARIGSGVSVLGRQVLVTRSTASDSYYLAIGSAGDSDRSFKGYLILEYTHPFSENSVIQTAALSVWSGGCLLPSSADSPGGLPRSLVMYWKTAGLVWRVENSAGS